MTKAAMQEAAQRLLHEVTIKSDNHEACQFRDDIELVARATLQTVAAPVQPSPDIRNSSAEKEHWGGKCTFGGCKTPRACEYEGRCCSTPSPDMLDAKGKDKCEFCLGAKGGVPGHENVFNEVVVCDYCTPLVQKVRAAMLSAKDTK